MSIVEKMYPSAADGIDDREQPDFTDKYNTKLSADEEKKYQAWADRQKEILGRDIRNDNFDYDTRGLFRETNGADLKPGHGTDRYKKPNHPTFSDQSVYHGVDGKMGGRWVEEGGKGKFIPSDQNIKNLGKGGLRRYFNEREPDIELVIE